MDLSFAAVRSHAPEDHPRISALRPQFNTAPLALAKSKIQHAYPPPNDDYLDNIITFRKKCNNNEQSHSDHQKGGVSFPVSILPKSSFDPQICEQRAITQLFDQSDELQRHGMMPPEGSKLKYRRSSDEHSSLSAFNYNEASYMSLLLSAKRGQNDRQLVSDLNQSSSDNNIYLKMWRQYKNKMLLKQKITTNKISKTQAFEGRCQIEKFLSQQDDLKSFALGSKAQQCGHDLKSYKKAGDIRTRKHSQLLDSRNLKEMQREKLLKWRSESQQILKDSFCHGLKMTFKESKSKNESHSPLVNLPVSSNFPQRANDSQNAYFIKNNDNLLLRKSHKKIENKKQKKRSKSLISQNEQKEGKWIDAVEGTSLARTNGIKQPQQSKQTFKQEKSLPRMESLQYQPKNSGSNCIKNKIASIFRKLNLHYRNESIISPKSLENSLKIRAKSNVQIKEIEDPIKKKKPLESMIKISQNKEQLNQSIIHSIKLFSESRKTRNVLQLLGQERFRLKSSGSSENRSASMLNPLS